MTAPRASIDRGVAALFRAITGQPRGDRLMVVEARSELVGIAAATEGFEGRLVTAAVDQLVAWNTCPNATRDEIERAICIDVRRHVGSSIFLAQLEPWGHARSRSSPSHAVGSIRSIATRCAAFAKSESRSCGSSFAISRFTRRAARGGCNYQPGRRY